MSYYIGYNDNKFLSRSVVLLFNTPFRLLLALFGQTYLKYCINDEDTPLLKVAKIFSNDLTPIQKANDMSK